MYTMRVARWPQDETLLASLDTEFVTARIYHPLRDGLGVRLVEKTIPPLRKRYPFDPANTAERANWDFTVIAEDAGEIAGFVAAQYVAWNRRVVLWHLYVMPTYRRQGLGTKLLEAAQAYAHSVGARCLWLETQNINHPAIQFYLRSGFHFCGFDDTLYDPDTLAQDEVALFFARL